MKKALITVPAIVIVGSVMGIVSNSGFENGWYADLVKPAFQPPGWAFGAVWTTLYTMMGIALAAILNEPPSPMRRTCGPLPRSTATTVGCAGSSEALGVSRRALTVVGALGRRSHTLPRGIRRLGFRVRLIEGADAALAAWPNTMSVKPGWKTEVDAPLNQLLPR